jgi:hypothetical protein
MNTELENKDLTSNDAKPVLYDVESLKLKLYNRSKSAYKCGESKHTIAILEEDFDDLIDDIIGSTDIYCKICSSCGEEDCCIPTICKNHKDGIYCESNLLAMKVAYCTLKDFYNWLYENEGANKYIIDKLNKLKDKVEDEFYTKP